MHEQQAANFNLVIFMGAHSKPSAKLDPKHLSFSWVLLRMCILQKIKPLVDIRQYM